MKKLVSHRNALPQSGIREIFERAFGVSNVIHLEMGEPNFDTPDFIKASAIESINKGETHYTPSAGIPSLREAIASRIRVHNIEASAEQITVTTGGVAALTLSLQSLVEENEEVLLPDPGWIYPNMVLSQGSIPVFYPLRMENDFLPDMSDLEPLVTERTKAIIVNSPSNPTGAVYTQEKVLEMLDFASRHDLYIISDEVYDGIVLDGSHISFKALDTEGRVVSIFSFSKNYAMTGWRVGYAVAPLHIANLISKLQESMVACCSSISQKAAEAAITGPQQVVDEMRMTYKKRNDQVDHLLKQAGVRSFKPKGAFYVMIDVSASGLSGKQFAFELLDKKLVATAPGNAFGKWSDNMIRISLATEETELLEGVRRICSFIKEKENIQ